MLARKWWREIFDSSSVEGEPTPVSAAFSGLKVLSLEFRRSVWDSLQLEEYRERLFVDDAKGLRTGAELIEIAFAFEGLRELGVGELCVVLWDEGPESSWVRGEANLEKALRDCLMGPREVDVD